MLTLLAPHHCVCAHSRRPGKLPAILVVNTDSFLHQVRYLLSMQTRMTAMPKVLELLWLNSINTNCISLYSVTLCSIYLFHGISSSFSCRILLCDHHQPHEISLSVHQHIHRMLTCTISWEFIIHMPLGLCLLNLSERQNSILCYSCCRYEHDSTCSDKPKTFLMIILINLIACMLTMDSDICFMFFSSSGSPLRNEHHFQRE